jgi:hypothetical protein
MKKDQLDDIRQQQLAQIDERQVHTLPYAYSCFIYFHFFRKLIINKNILMKFGDNMKML